MKCASPSLFLIRHDKNQGLTTRAYCESSELQNILALEVVKDAESHFRGMRLASALRRYGDRVEPRLRHSCSS